MAAAGNSCDKQAKKENRREQIVPVIDFTHSYVYFEVRKLTT